MTSEEYGNDPLAAAAADAEAEQDVETTWTRHRRPATNPSAVYSVRIPVERIDELRRLAVDRGVAPTVLIRTWVLAQLDATREEGDDTRRWEREVRATTERLRSLLDARPVEHLADAS